MDAMGVDIQVISVSPYGIMLGTPELGREVAQMINDEMAEDIAKHPDRLIGLGTIPLQNTEMAITELEMCERTGL